MLLYYYCCLKKPSVCSGCFHHFCFNCITKWANVSNNCPVCRKEYKNILHNFNTTVRIIRFGDERVKNKKLRLNSLTNQQQEDNLIENKPSLKRDPFYIFETGDQQMIGVPIINEEQITNNIVQLNTNTVNSIPEIDIVNITKNENGGRLITRHNYQLASNEQQVLINELITSAVNRSVEEHKETITQISTNANEDQHTKSILNKNDDLTRLIDVYTFDRTRRQGRGRGRNLFTIQSRYNLRPLVGSTRVNPQVNRTRLISLD